MTPVVFENDFRKKESLGLLGHERRNPLVFRGGSCIMKIMTFGSRRNSEWAGASSWKLGGRMSDGGRSSFLGGHFETCGHALSWGLRWQKSASFRAVMVVSRWLS